MHFNARSEDIHSTFCTDIALCAVQILYLLAPDKSLMIYESLTFQRNDLILLSLGVYFIKR